MARPATPTADAETTVRSRSVADREGLRDAVAERTADAATARGLAAVAADRLARFPLADGTGSAESAGSETANEARTEGRA